MHRLTRADLRPDTRVLVPYDDSWWPAKIRKAKATRVSVKTSILGRVVPQQVPLSDVAVRLDPTRHAPPKPGSRVLAAENYALYQQQDLALDATIAMLGWRRGEVVAVREGEIDVQFDPDDENHQGDTEELHWVPLAGVACFVDDASDSPAADEHAARPGPSADGAPRPGIATPRRDRLARTLGGWALFLGGLLALALVDRNLRATGRPDGLGEPLLPLLVMVLGSAAALLLWRGAAGWPTPTRVILVGLQLGLGFILYAVATLAYFCGAGVDCT